MRSPATIEKRTALLTFIARVLAPEPAIQAVLTSGPRWKSPVQRAAAGKFAADGKHVGKFLQSDLRDNQGSLGRL